MKTKRFATAMTLTLAMTAGCTDSSIDDATLNSREDGLLSRMFNKITSHFVERAEEPTPIAPKKPWTAPEAGSDPVIDELFDAMGLEEVEPDGELELDGAIVGLFEHFPDENDPDDYYDEVCFFAKSPDQQPSAETLFYAEMYGFRPYSGSVSDIHGQPIEQECVWCEEGNTGGDETRVIFYVNGIRTNVDKHCGALQQIADLTGAVTIGVYNESDGAIKDVWQTGLDRFTVSLENKLADWGINQTVKIHENKAATMLTNMIVQRLRSDKHVEIWAHSQGGAVTSLALHRAIRALEDEGDWPILDDSGEVDTNAIKVVTFGSAAPKWPDGGFPKGPNYTHYVHLRDATPNGLGVGAWGKFTTLGESRAGDDAKMVFFDGEPADLEELHPDEKISVFSQVDPGLADVRLSDLDPLKYHHVGNCYFGMFEQLHGSWVKNNF